MGTFFDNSADEDDNFIGYSAGEKKVIRVEEQSHLSLRESS